MSTTDAAAAVAAVQALSQREVPNGAAWGGADIHLQPDGAWTAQIHITGHGSDAAHAYRQALEAAAPAQGVALSFSDPMDENPAYNTFIAHGALSPAPGQTRTMNSAAATTTVRPAAQPTSLNTAAQPAQPAQDAPSDVPASEQG